MRIGLGTRTFTFQFPIRSEPRWSNRVERWYQLDAFAYGLIEAWWNWKHEGPSLESPTLMLAASPGASNESDAAYANSPASAHRFVHTLPNVRFSPLCQAMEWSGPILCVQSDPSTFTEALIESAGFVVAGQPRVWVMGVWTESARTTRYRVDLFEVSGNGAEGALAMERNGAPSPLPTDRELMQWLKGTEPRLPLSAGLLLERKGTKGKGDFSHELT